jgi:hypothetical protein
LRADDRERCRHFDSTWKSRRALRILACGPDFAFLLLRSACSKCLFQRETLMFPETRGRRIAVGAFESRDKAEAAIAELEHAGFPSSEIGIAARNMQGEWHDFQQTEAETAKKGAQIGAAAASAARGLRAIGIAAGMLPVLGPVIAGGLLASILAGTTAGAAAGGLVGLLVGLGLSEENAHNFESEFARGRVVLTVRGGDRFDQASRIMLSHGATEVTAAPAVTA